MPIPLVIIAGPTGVGKTQVALELAETLDGEIVGADSRQIYRYMNIGTAKPTPAERVPHHLLDIRDPDEDYSAADFARDATAAIRDIHSRHKLPLLVGGTGLYIQAAVYGIFEGPGRDEAFRTQQHAFAQTHGNAALHHRLAQVDPETARRVHPNDLGRIIRALEVYHLTGQPISTRQAAATVPLADYDVCFIVLTMAREALYARLNVRVEQMVQHGLVEEVRDLLERGYHADLSPMNSIGYQEIAAYLAGTQTLPAAIALIKRNTRRYAKRQLTWFRKYPQPTWIPVEAPPKQNTCVNTCRQHIAAWQARAARPV